MITHKMLAKQQKYAKLLNILDDVLKNNGYPIEYKKQKHSWNELIQQLEIARQKTIREEKVFLS